MRLGRENYENPGETLDRVFKNMTGTSLLRDSQKKDSSGHRRTLVWPELKKVMTVRTDLIEAANKEKSLRELID